MARIRALVGAAFCGFVHVALAQTPADELKGTWINRESGFCGESTVIVTAVEPNGIVRGTFMCKRTGWKPVMGEKIDKNAVRGTLTGTRFVMENADGGGFDLQLEGVTLKGHGRGRASMTPNPSLYTKQ